MILQGFSSAAESVRDFYGSRQRYNAPTFSEILQIRPALRRLAALISAVAPLYFVCNTHFDTPNAPLCSPHNTIFPYRIMLIRGLFVNFFLYTYILSTMRVEKSDPPPVAWSINLGSVNRESGFGNRGARIRLRGSLERVCDAGTKKGLYGVIHTGLAYAVYLDAFTSANPFLEAWR